MNDKLELKDLWPIIEEKINLGGEAVINPGGVSMLPLIKAGRDSVVLVKPKSTLKKYDVALYQRKSGQFVLHRVVKVLDNTYTMCGDNQFWHEKDIPKDAVLALMTAVIRKGKKIDVNNGMYIVYSVLIVYFRIIYGFFKRALRKIIKR